ncbi:DUF2612 domain-containing protein [Bradyrhizobium genosp. L]|uniref:DUF2612 domain-containing protein n=1 Tax=Bradyrhizobium genosp. L TaxID=83637 RepID=UPI0018A2D4FC|nr:DUF2612 domain-containing protein [Bradyrhizobium genosp. L]QPF81685.1 DUF2612 domain-containing protein [Bradyrhizobium genosp. L]
MSGPPYPHPNPAPGSNAIGSFAIGVSPIGTIPTFDVWTTILAQYANSPIITSWVNSFNAAMDLTEAFDNFYDLIWNVLTAQGYGLDVWGRIVGVQRAISIPGGVQYLGFEEAGGSWTGFNQGGFYSGGGLTQNYVLSDDDFRKLILAKASGNISDGSIPSVNAILLGLFPGRGTCYIADNLNMSQTYTFNFALTAVEIAIVLQANVLPNAAGVIVNILVN